MGGALIAIFLTQCALRRATLAGVANKYVFSLEGVDFNCRFLEGIVLWRCRTGGNTVHAFVYVLYNQRNVSIHLSIRLYISEILKVPLVFLRQWKGPIFQIAVVNIYIYDSTSLVFLPLSFGNGLRVTIPCLLDFLTQTYWHLATKEKITFRRSLISWTQFWHASRKQSYALLWPKAVKFLPLDLLQSSLFWRGDNQQTGNSKMTAYWNSI